MFCGVTGANLYYSGNSEIQNIKYLPILLYLVKKHM